MKDVKDIILKYIQENQLEEDVARGHVKLEPFISRLVGELKSDQK